ncbi:MAG: YihY/virulence factor BrkB family protein [Xanthobacteraceae bacterium]
MTLPTTKLWHLIRDAAGDWVTHKDGRQGAALAYYSVFSLGPVLVIAVAVAGLVFGQDAARGEVELQLRGLLGDTAAKAVDALLVSASKPAQGVFATLLGTVILLFSALGVVVQLKDAFNTVWEVDAKKISGIWQFFRAYLVSLAAVLALGFLLLVSLLLTAGLSAASHYLGAATSLQLAGSLISFVAIAVIFAMMFKWLPDADVEWRDVWLGAGITAALFELGKFLIGLYIGKLALDSTYGAAASIVILLIWVYYSSQIVLLGAEFTHVYARRRAPQPSASAAPPPAERQAA